MKYDTKHQNKALEALEYIERLITQEQIVEVKKVSRKRSLKQNNYLHVTFGIFGLETGYTIEEAKSLYKRLNKDIYVYEKKGNSFIKSSADLATDEMTQSIDKWRKYAGEHGVEIPVPTDKEAMMHWQNQIEMQTNYLKR